MQKFREFFVSRKLSAPKVLYHSRADGSNAFFILILGITSERLARHIDKASLPVQPFPPLIHINITYKRKVNWNKNLIVIYLLG